MQWQVLAQRLPSRKLSQFDPLDWVALVVFVLGVSCVASGVLSRQEATSTLTRVAPLLLFLGAVIVLAELLAKSGVFTALATVMARAARGYYVVLFLCCVLFATLTTIFLNLDTTAVLLTPVMLATAKRINVPAMPLAMTTVWLANTASLLLPVSNLTNLLGMSRLGLTTTEFAMRMWLPQLVAVAVTACLLWFFHWRPAKSTQGKYEIPVVDRPPDRVLFWLGSACVSVFVVAMLIGVPLHVASLSAAAVMVIAVVFRQRSWLDRTLLPWRLLLFVSGLFLVIQTVGILGLDHIVSWMIGEQDNFAGVARSATAGGVLANVINNLPGYIAIEQVIPDGNENQLFALLLGVNIGPLITPWASLAILLWHERCQSAGVTISWRRFIATGAATAVTTLIAATATYALVHG